MGTFFFLEYVHTAHRRRHLVIHDVVEFGVGLFPAFDDVPNAHACAEEKLPIKWCFQVMFLYERPTYDQFDTSLSLSLSLAWLTDLSIIHK